MKISVTTLAVLLSASAVHALPADPPLATPPPALSKDIGDDLEDAGDAGGLLLGGLLNGIPKLIADIKDSKAKQAAWRDEQKRKAEEEEEKKLLAALAARREVAVDRLEHSEGLQSEAEVEVRQAEGEHDAAVRKFVRLDRELAELSEREKSVTAERQSANLRKMAMLREVRQAQSELEAVVDEADELREAIAEIDELVAKVGISPEDLHKIDPVKYPKLPEEPEEPEGHKKEDPNRAYPAHV